MYDISFVSDSNVHSFEQIEELLFNRVGNVYEFEKIKQKYINNPGLILVVLRNGDYMMSAMIDYKSDDDISDGLIEYMRGYILDKYPEYNTMINQLVSLVESCFIAYTNDSECGYIFGNSVNKSIDQVISILNDINNSMVKDKIVIDINSNTLN